MNEQEKVAKAEQEKVAEANEQEKVAEAEQEKQDASRKEFAAKLAAKGTPATRLALWREMDKLVRPATKAKPALHLDNLVKLAAILIPAKYETKDELFDAYVSPNGYRQVLLNGTKDGKIKPNEYKLAASQEGYWLEKVESPAIVLPRNVA